MSLRTRIFAAVVFVVSTACSPPDEGPNDAGDTAPAADAADAARGDASDAGDGGRADAGPDTSATVNDWTVAVDPDSGGWTVSSPDGEPVLESPEGTPPLRIARGEPAVKNEVGVFRIQLTGDRSTLGWKQPADSAPDLRETDAGRALVWSLQNGSGSAMLEFLPADGEDLRVRLRVQGAEVDAGEVNLACRDGEAFFGLGTQVTGLDLRGRTYPLWTQEQGVGKPEDGGIFPLNQPPEAAYAPMGLWHSTAGYSALVDHDSYSEVDVCDTRDAVRLRSFRRMPSLTLDLAGTPSERVQRVSHYTGRLEERPPAWIFGPWVTAVGGPWRLDDVTDTIRSRDIPVTAIWSEDWIGWDGSGANRRLTYAWEWSKDTYPMLPSRIEQLHANGFAFLGYFNPFVPEPTLMWNEGTDGGYLLENADGETVSFKDPGLRKASMVDLSNPEAVEWLQQYQKKAIEEVGLDGWMADFGEWYPLEARPRTDVSAWEYHNRYPVEWAEANRGSLEAARSEGANGLERVFFTRSGWASTNGGSAGFAPAMWAGDQQTDWTRTDGLPSVVPIVAHAGLSGVPIMGSDIGGYSSLDRDPRSKSLFVRWTAMAAFHPLMRTHHGDEECNNWSFDRDDETLAHFQRYTSIHNLLYPYLASLLDEAMATGLPLTRHPWLAAPDHSALWEGEDWLFFLGDDLLVAPVLENQATRRTVEVPTRQWWPLFGDAPVGSSGEETEGVVRLEASAPVTEIPVYTRPGTALPLLSAPVDSLYGATKQGVTDLDDRKNAYRLALYPDESGAVDLEGVAGVTVEGTGLPTSASLTDTTIAIDGSSPPPCDTASDDAHCVDEDAGLVRLRGAGSLELSVGDGTITVEADRPVDLILGLAGDAWGRWAEPTTLENLDANAPSYCQDAP